MARALRLDSTGKGETRLLVRVVRVLLLALLLLLPLVQVLVLPAGLWGSVRRRRDKHTDVPVRRAPLVGFVSRSLKQTGEVRALFGCMFGSIRVSPSAAGSSGSSGSSAVLLLRHDFQLCPCDGPARYDTEPPGESAHIEPGPPAGQEELLCEPPAGPGGHRGHGLQPARGQRH